MAIADSGKGGEVDKKIRYRLKYLDHNIQYLNTKFQRRVILIWKLPFTNIKIGVDAKIESRLSN